MIKSRRDYLDYLEADRKALGKRRQRPLLLGDDIWKFERLLRACEYFGNCKRSWVWKPVYYYLQYSLYHSGVMFGFTIHPNNFGPGLSIAHRGTIVVHPDARIGANCRIHVCVNIGSAAGEMSQVPKIGNNVYIGPGVKIFGAITIADGIAIGANAVVNKSFPEPNVSIAGVPAKKIADKGSTGFLTEGYSKPYNDY